MSDIARIIIVIALCSLVAWIATIDVGHAVFAIVLLSIPMTVAAMD